MQASKTPAPVNLGQTVVTVASGLEISLTKVEIADKGLQANGEFKVVKGRVDVGVSGPAIRSVRPSRRVASSENDGVLVVVGRIAKGKPDVFWATDTWTTNEKGQRNVQDDMAGLSNGREFTLMFNVPKNSQKLWLHFGDALEIGLTPFLQQQFLIAFDQAGGKCTLRLEWENTRASVDISEK